MPLPRGNSLTPASTPVHVAQLAMVMLKATFAEIGGTNYPYKYTQDINTTGILIDTVFNKESDIKKIRPTLIVSRGPINGQQLVLGDTGHQLERKNERWSVGLVSSSIEVKILSRHYEETDNLSNEVFNFLLTCRNLLGKKLGVHRMEMPGLSQIQPFEEDDRLFLAQASMQFSMQYNWHQIDPDILLRGIDLYLNDVLAYSGTFEESNP